MLELIPRRERIDLLIAWLALSIAFAFVLRDSPVVYPFLPGDSFTAFLVVFAISLVTAGIGFALHELAHKFAAMKFGYWAEFRKENLMLLIAVALAALVGVVFAAPGATVIYGNTTKAENGKISAAGPLTNLILCIVFATILLFSGGITSPAGFGGLIGIVGLQVNGMIAAFNMLPVSVLDGRKILAWNPGVFTIMIVAGFGIVIAPYYHLLSSALF